MMRKAIKAKVIRGTFQGENIIVEGTDYDLWGREWGEMGGNPAALNYAMRMDKDNIPDSGTVYGGKRENGYSTLFHESEIEFLDNEEERDKLSTGTPNTLKGWYLLCSTIFGEDAAPTKFIKEKMDKQGPDQKVIADEKQLLHMLGNMFSEEKKDVK